ncbi:hypothetical protein C0991_003843 [Blastosporella zonata]|nr:hypothetical protein C0991_003843 [Blastosporella zonata]
MTTLWFMQAALQDVSVSGHHTQSFAICQRVLHMCHEIIFGDLPAPTPSPYGGLTLPSQSRFARRKVKYNIEPAIAGIGLVLAGAPGMPRLTEIMGQVTVEQGRAEENTHDFKSVESQEEDIALGLSPSQTYRRQTTVDEDGDEDDSPESDDTHTTPPLKLEDAPTPAAFARRRMVGPAQTVPALPLHLRSIRRTRASEDPLGQHDRDPVVVPYLSTPSISSSRPTPCSATMNRVDSLLEAYDPESQSQLLRSHYCRSEVQFLLGLENICNRLLVIPKPARVSALRAELTALNHKLPAEVCMPMWCSSSDSPTSQKHTTQPHHRIVRIPPGESVVLNSAERAPYLLLIEVLNDDLDFQPTKRANKEVLKKIVAKEDERKGTSRDLNPFRNLRTAHPDPSTAAGPALETSRPWVLPLAAVTTSPVLADDDEEIDLVEQLYGADQSLRSRAADLSESIVLPPAPKNKELDMVTWSRPAQTPSTPTGEPSPSSVSSRPSLPSRPSAAPSPTRSSNREIPNPPGSANITDGIGALSLDDYSERMRTAAIMLAQLNASLVREQANSAPQPPSGNTQQVGSSNWLTGGKWLTSTNQPSHKSHPPPTPSSSDHRMKLQHAEAAAIRDRIMKEMLALEEQRMQRMRENREDDGIMRLDISGSSKSAEDEGIIRRELNKVDPSAVVFNESWAAKKVCGLKTTSVSLNSNRPTSESNTTWFAIWTPGFHILITGGTSGLIETITDAVSIHSIKKAEYARRIADGRLGHVTLKDHFKSTYGDPSSAKFARAQRNFAKSLAGSVILKSISTQLMVSSQGYSVVTYLLQVKDRHNGNILLDRDGHLVHIDFGFILSNTPGNIGFEAAPFKLPVEYIEVLGGINGAPFLEFRRLFREGFEAARKHCDRIITLVELMQKDSALPCFAAFGEQTSVQLRERFQPTLTHSLVGSYVDRLIDTSLGSHWTRLYDSFQYYSQSIL